jgi:hypothetical protein
MVLDHRCGNHRWPHWGRDIDETLRPDVEFEPIQSDQHQLQVLAGLLLPVLLTVGSEHTAGRKFDPRQVEVHMRIGDPVERLFPLPVRGDPRDESRLPIRLSAPLAAQRESDRAAQAASRVCRRSILQ